MATKLVKQPDGTYRYEETETSQQRARNLDTAKERLDENLSAVGNDTKARKKLLNEFEESKAAIGFRTIIGSGSGTGMSARPEDSPGRRTQSTNKTIYDFKDNVRHADSVSEVPEGVKTLEDFGGNTAAFRSYLVEKNKGGNRTPFDFDNPAGIQLSEQERRTLEQLNARDTADNEATGGAGKKTAAAYYNAIIAKRNANETTADKVQSGLRGKREEAIDYATNKSNFTNEDGEVDVVAQNQALINAFNISQETTQSQFEVAGNEAQDAFEAGGVDFTPPEAPDFLTEQDLKASLLGQQILDDQKEQHTELEEDFERQRRELKEVQEARQRREEEAQRRQAKSVDAQTGGLQGMVSNASFAAGIVQEGRRYLDELRRRDEIKMNELIDKQNDILSKLDEDNRKVFQDWVDQERENMQKDYENQLEVWKEQNELRRQQITENRLQKGLQLDAMGEQRLRQGEARQQYRLQFDMQKYFQDRDDTANQLLDKQAFDLFQKSDGKIVAGALAEWFVEQGIEPRDAIAIMDSKDKTDVMEQLLSNPTYATQFAKMPEVMRNFVIGGLADIEDRVRLQALSGALKVSGSGSGTKKSKGNKLTSSDERALIQAGVSIADRTKYSEFTQEELLLIQKEDEKEDKSYTEQDYLDLAKDATDLGNQFYGAQMDKEAEMAAELSKQYLNEAERLRSGAKAQPLSLLNIFGGFFGGGSSSSPSRSTPTQGDDFLDY